MPGGTGTAFVVLEKSCQRLCLHVQVSLLVQEMFSKLYAKPPEV